MSAAAKLERGLSGTMNSVPINLNEPMIKLINELYETGLYGNSTSAAVQRIFSEGLEESIDRMRKRSSLER